MRVLFATYPTAFHTPGGGEIQLLAYREHLSVNDVDVRLFDQWNPRLEDQDVVHFFSCMGGSWHFCAFVKRLGLPLIVSASLWITEATKNEYPIDEIRRQLELADLVVCNSNLECEQLSSVLDLPRALFTTVYNGADDRFFEPADPAMARASFGDGYVLNVGNIEPRKNQLALVRAMKAMPGRRLVLIGHVRDPAYAERVLGEGGPQVTYAGPLAHDALMLRSAYAGCATMALPSLLETPGLAAIEAGAQGAPLVITREGSCREYFGDGAVYVDPASVDSISAAIAQVLDEPPPRPRLEEFRWRNCCAALPAIYRRAVASAGNRSSTV